MRKYRAIWLFLVFFLTVGSMQAQDTCPKVPDLSYGQTSDCAGMGQVCIPVSVEQFLSDDTEVLLDGSTYVNGITGCNFDTMVIYSYTELIGGGNSGPYILKKWEVNDTFYTATAFPDIPSLVDSLNKWDVNGNWNISTTSSNMFGGDLKNKYGNMVIEQVLLPDVPTSLGPIVSQIPQGTIVKAVGGTHELIIRDTVQNCADTTTLIVKCVETEEINITTYVGLVGKTCVDASDLQGDIQTMTACFVDSTNSTVNFAIDETTHCIKYSTMNEGTETACVVTCDTFGICDTTRLIINVVTPEKGIVVRSVEIGDKVTECFKPDNLPGNLTISNFCPTSSGRYTNISINETDFCVTAQAKNEVGVDTVCIQVCNENGVCDTTTFYIAVTDYTATGGPIAVGDTVKAIEGVLSPLDVLANDKAEEVSSLLIITQGTNGLAMVQGDSIIMYEGNEEFCGTDMFQYAVCNASGCDTASVEVNVTCKDIKVYNAFSPNKDGVNDKFMIDGLELYPQAEISILNVWGNIIYQNTNPYPGNGYPDILPYNEQTAWDGTWAGKDLPDGNYFYVIKLNDGSGIKYSGYVYLFR